MRDLKRVWIYYLVIILLLIFYDLFIIKSNPSEPSLYVVHTWTLSFLLAYPVISLISGVLLRVIVAGWKKQILLIVFSSPIFFIASAIMIGTLLSWSEKNVLRFSIGGSIKLALEAIILQMLVIGIAELFSHILTKVKK